MSFKRVADDFDDFKLQKKRRVNDLLLDAIPTDETILMKNGKLACLVCSHKPVFDTTAMLTIHRKGKKHIANALVKLERAKEDAEIRQKRQQETYLKMKRGASENPLIGLTQVEKQLALNEPVNQKPSSNDCTSKLDGSSTSRPFFGKKKNFNFKELFDNTKHSNCVLKEDYGLRERNNHKREDFLKVNPLTKQPSEPCRGEQLLVVCDGKDVDNVLDQTSSKTTDSAILDSPNSSTFYSHDQHSSLNNLDPKSKALYLSKLRQIGWVLGTNGKWEKDEDAEFESDEDEPPTPKTLLSG